MLDFFQSRFQTIKDYFSGQSFSFENFTDLFSWNFWTESFLASSSDYTVLILIFVALLLTSLFIWRKTLKKKHGETPVYEWEIVQILNVIMLVIVVSTSYLLFRSWQLPYLSSRLVVLISFIITDLWIGWIIFSISKKANNERVAYLEKERFSRYIPKKKKARK